MPFDRQMMKWMPILRIWPEVTSRDENAGNTARFCVKVAGRREVCAALDWFRYKPKVLNLKPNLLSPTPVVLKIFGSWATFVFQKPFAGHKN